MGPDYSSTELIQTCLSPAFAEFRKELLLKKAEISQLEKELEDSMGLLSNISAILNVCILI